MKNQIKTVTFFEAGKAFFTVSNPVNEHYTYKIRKKKFDSKSCWFIYLLTGTDNESSYTYLGCYEPSLKTVRLTSKSQYLPESKPVKVLQWAINKVKQNSTIPEGYKIQHEGKCARCGRLLTTPQSIDLGIGPECIKHMK